MYTVRANVCEFAVFILERWWFALWFFAVLSHNLNKKCSVVARNRKCTALKCRPTATLSKKGPRSTHYILLYCIHRPYIQSRLWNGLVPTLNTYHTAWFLSVCCCFAEGNRFSVLGPLSSCCILLSTFFPDEVESPVGL